MSPAHLERDVTHWIQVALVALAVTASALYAAYVLMPASWRSGIDAVLDRLLPESMRQRRASRLSGCSGCANNPATPRVETRISTHQIGRRS
jgi:hypothetical protein